MLAIRWIVLALVLNTAIAAGGIWCVASAWPQPLVGSLADLGRDISRQGSRQ